MTREAPIGERASTGRGRRRFGRLGSVALVVAFLAVLVYGFSTTAPDDRIDRGLAEGRTSPAPGFSLEVLEGGKVPPGLQRVVAKAVSDGRLGLDELRGTPVVLNLWASWCTPCRDEAGRLQRAWESWGERGVLFLGLNMQDLRGDARAFLREFAITYPTVRDPGKDVASAYGATGIPETFFVDERGRVVGHVVGAVSGRQIRAGAAAARSGRVAGTRSGGASFSTR
ncbi:hypothetical protein LCGC14_2079140 [marine sediment metagenome]|uniref:Thioredoxin domain-containing protein n=1 Tax=marine sediment metagenome TaxID=412755 RepID=A0A0F9GUH3_9ZZZZ